MRRYGSGATGNTQSPLRNADKRDLDAKSEGPGDFAHQGYRVLSKAERGEPRQRLSEDLDFDQGPYHSMDYPDR